ncbi:LVIVD repeat-containing protein [Candidatus Lokiarchaeum ossiferum]|uniref:LVIVD repeat-containing protein n=1 Tax=Candidatus Lokiarchaeum ossiferum TaxID=2951803 RepID=UPI00352DAEC3
MFFHLNKKRIVCIIATILLVLYLNSQIGFGSTRISEYSGNSEDYFEKSGSFYDGGIAKALTVFESNLFVADGDDGIEIFDISLSGDPLLISKFYDGGKAENIKIRGDIAYVADGIDGLEILNISNINNIVEIGQFSNGEKTYDVEISRDLAFISQGFSGLRIINISDPTNPTQINSYMDDTKILHARIFENCMILSENADGIVIIDIQDPLNLIPLVSFSDGGKAKKVWNSDKFIFVADGKDGLEILNRTQSGELTKISQFYTEFLCVDIQVINNIAFISEVDGIFSALDLQNPSYPKKIGEYRNNLKIKSHYIYGDFAYLAMKENGIVILKVDIPKLQARNDIDDKIGTTPYRKISGFSTLSLIGLSFVIIITKKSHLKKHLMCMKQK